MIDRSSQPEVLAPAGSPEALRAAVLCGTDAVYLGLDVLNARRGAENFTRENLADTVAYCHAYGVRVLLTLNILLHEQERGQLIDAAEAACRAGVDAVIVQDLGVAALLRVGVPGLPLHASTQLAIHNPEGVRMAEELGFRRVVLARECADREIEEIVQASPVEIEAFVHGALCMSVSGQCYMSAVLGQRSGNRGLCAQPCRLPFDSGKTSHALSLKDMSLIDRAQRLGELGVRALKIEGRMKRPEYVAAAVSACRAALDGGTPDLDSLRAVFSRSGFTDGYFTGQRDFAMFGVRAKEDVTAAAGVLGRLENLYTDPRQHVRRVGLSMCLVMRADEPAVLEVSDTFGHTVRAEGECPQVAQNRPTDEERARASLGKLGGTPYTLEALTCEIGAGLMLPVSALNALRRDALDRLTTLRTQPRVLPFDRPAAEGAYAAVLAKTRANPPERPALRVRAFSAAQVSASMWEHADLITLPVPEVEALLDGLEARRLDKLCIGLPRMLFEGEATLDTRLAALWKAGVRHVQAGNLGVLRLARKHGFTIHGEPFLNVVNTMAAAELERVGADDLCLSYELTLDRAKRMGGVLPVGLTVYGHLPLMTVRNCPVQAAAGCAACRAGANTLTDRKGEKLAASCVWGCAELHNATPLFMADRLDELRGLDFIELRLTFETPEECARIWRAYREGDTPPARFTRGLLYKTIL